MFNWLKKLINIGVEAEPTGVRARNAKGHFVKDDKSTPNVNEAYVDGKTPKRKRKPAAKKAPAKRRGRPKGSKNKK